MTQFDFARHFDRLIQTFGARAFPEERNKLIWQQLCDMDDDWFGRLVDKMIGDLRQPPMLPDFRDSANRERKRIFDQEVNDVTREWTTEHQGLSHILSTYGGAKTLWGAVQYERKVVQEMEGLTDPHYPKLVNDLTQLSSNPNRQRELATTISELTEESQ